MKKALAYVLVAILTVSCLASCDLSEKEHKHTYGAWQYDEYKHWREYACGCEHEAEMDTHTNNDGDALCDICGYHVGVKEDYVVYCQYYYTNEYGSHTHTQISLEDLDVSILVEISNSLSYTEGDPGSSPTKIMYCVRHYDTATDPFFVTGDEQYLDLSANFTNERADVTYSVDYVNSQITRTYTTPEGEVEGYAKLSAEQLNAIKTAFQSVANVLEPQVGHAHTYQNYHDEISHGWSYTCGCMTPPNQAQHADGDGDGKCDDCEYVFTKESNGKN